MLGGHIFVNATNEFEDSSVYGTQHGNYKENEAKM